MSDPSAHELAMPAPLGLRLAGLGKGARERSLVRAAQRGSADARETLVRRHWAEAHRAAYMMLGDRAAAEDVAQESMVAAMAAIGDFDRRRPLRPWLHRIVINRARDWIRARERRGELSIEALEEREEAEDALAAGVQARTPHAPTALAPALDGLEPTTRAMVVLRYVLDYKAWEIGEMLGLSEGAVRTRLHRALGELRVGLEADLRPRPGRSPETQPRESKE
jgi:RNA polymerase sigma factor (sigma-70 family)